MLLHPDGLACRNAFDFSWFRLQRNAEGHRSLSAPHSDRLHCAGPVLLNRGARTILAPWELMIWGSILAGVRLRPSPAPVYRWVAAAVSLALVAAVGYMVYGESIHGFHNDASAEYAIAEGLLKMGLQPGEKVGAIGFDMDAHWVYLARLSIVAEIGTDETCLFWSEPAATQAQVLGKIRASRGERSGREYRRRGPDYFAARYLLTWRAVPVRARDGARSKAARTRRFF